MNFNTNEVDNKDMKLSVQSLNQNQTIESELGK
jgi:hypothetical protein